jgi:hypothetical protein
MQWKPRESRHEVTSQTRVYVAIVEIKLPAKAFQSFDENF